MNFLDVLAVPVLAYKIAKDQTSWPCGEQPHSGVEQENAEVPSESHDGPREPRSLVMLQQSVLHAKKVTASESCQV